MYSKIEKIYRKRLLSQRPTLDNDDIQLQFLLKYLPKDHNISILDAGCGNGNYAYYLSDKGYKNISAVDLFYEIKTEKFNYQQSSIDKMPFYDNSFDFIYSNSVIYYLRNPKDGIIEFSRALNKGGILFFTAHTKWSLFTLWRVIKRDIFKLKSMEHLRGVKFSSASYYREILEKNDFEIIMQDGYYVSFFLYPLYRKIIRGVEKVLNVKLPLFRFYTHNGIIGKIKSEIAYHSVFIAKKKNA